MKKIALICVVCLAVLSMSACDPTIHHWEFSQEYTEVKSIQIMSGSPEGYNVLANYIDINLAQKLFEDVKKLEYRKYWPNPTSSYSACGYIFVIEYNNGDREIISEWEPKYVTKDGQDTISWLYCEEEQFTAFIQSYLD